jgi:hypothetical protein
MTGTEAARAKAREAGRRWFERQDEATKRAMASDDWDSADLADVLTDAGMTIRPGFMGGVWAAFAAWEDR